VNALSSKGNVHLVTGGGGDHGYSAVQSNVTLYQVEGQDKGPRRRRGIGYRNGSSASRRCHIISSVRKKATPRRKRTGLT